MRKLILLMVMMAVCICSTAQDVIFLTNGDEIEAKVVRVTETELEYKRYDNIEGPSYVKSLANVFMVKYENGAKDVFTTPESVMQQVRNVDGDNVQEMGEHSPLTLMRKSNNIISNTGTLKKDDLQRLLGEAAFDDYMSARNGYEKGYLLVGLGWASAVLGGMAMLAATTSASDGDLGVSSTLTFVGVMAFLGHSVMVPVGYVVSGINKGKISRIAEEYNVYNKSISMDLSVSPMLLNIGDNGIAPGVGVSLSF